MGGGVGLMSAGGEDGDKEKEIGVELEEAQRSLER